MEMVQPVGYLPDVTKAENYREQMLRPLGYLPDVPKVEDYHERHDKIAPLLARTRLAHRVSAKIKAMGLPAPTVAAAPAAPPQ